MKLNVLNFGAVVEHNWKENLKDMKGDDWKPKYTFYSDFGTAEFCEQYLREKNAIRKTYDEVIKSWGNNFEALVEIILTLNHKSWAYYGDKTAGVDAQFLGVSKERGNEMAQLYVELYEKADDLFWEKFSNNEEATDYHFEVLD